MRQSAGKHRFTNDEKLQPMKKTFKIATEKIIVPDEEQATRARSENRRKCI
jgi:hypothetical protein